MPIKSRLIKATRETASELRNQALASISSLAVSRVPDPRPLAPPPCSLKRLFDICVASLGLLILSPVLLAIAIAVKLNSPGPILFRQERVGRGFRPFRIYKFRTMVVDAPNRGGQITTGHDDPRITRVGRFLRRWKFDELPQFLNVVVGEMSLVGPRPEVPRFVEMFRSDYDDILKVRPGITDLASIKFRDEASLLAGTSNPEQVYVQQILPEKLALAHDYVARASFGMDLRILFQTAWRMARG